MRGEEASPEPSPGPEPKDAGRFAPHDREPLIPRGEGSCVWMQAGVLAYWLCDLEYRCNECPLDAALRHAGRSPVERLEAKQALGAAVPAAGASVPPAGAPEAGPAPPAAGVLDELLDLRLPALDPALRYHAAHTWVRIETAARVRVGLDHFAARIVGHLRSVIVPQPGARVTRGHPCAWLDQEGGTLTVLAPLSGVICSSNAGLAERPDLVFEDPTGGGWLFTMQPTDLEAEAQRLQDAGLFARHLQRDVERWQGKVRRALRTVTPPVGQTLADGGARVRDIGQLLGARRQHEIAALFLAATGSKH